MFQSDRIWSIGESALTFRNSAIAIDSDDMPIDTKDSERSIHVTTGLLLGDFAVFASRIGEDRHYMEPIGFLVTKVDSDGGGIITHHAKVISSYQNWQTTYLTEQLRKVDVHDPEALDAFGLQDLHKWLQ